MKKKKSIVKKVKKVVSPLHKKMSMEEFLTQALCCVPTEALVAYLPAKMNVMISQCQWEISSEEHLLDDIKRGWMRTKASECKSLIKQWQKRQGQLTKANKLISQAAKIFVEIKSPK